MKRYRGERHFDTKHFAKSQRVLSPVFLSRYDGVVWNSQGPRLNLMDDNDPAREGRGPVL